MVQNENTATEVASLSNYAWRIIGFALVLVLATVFRAFQTNYYSYLFLIYNAFLAILPLFLLLVVQALNRNSWWVWMVVALLLPNAPYLLTVILHLPPQWTLGFFFDVVLCLGYALWGLVNLEVMTDAFFQINGLKKMSQWAAWGFRLACAWAIWAGKFERINSWDLVFHPVRVMEAIMHSFTMATGGIILVLFVLLVNSRWLWCSFGRKEIGGTK